jgi:hypothetical protein
MVKCGVLFEVRHFGRAMAQAVSRRPLITEARLRTRISPYGICGEQSGTGTGFSLRVLRFSAVSIRGSSDSYFI